MSFVCFLSIYTYIYFFSDLRSQVTSSNTSSDCFDTLVTGGHENIQGVITSLYLSIKESGMHFEI